MRLETEIRVDDGGSGHVVVLAQLVRSHRERRPETHLSSASSIRLLTVLTKQGQSDASQHNDVPEK